jgi:copper chaperone
LSRPACSWLDGAKPPFSKELNPRSIQTMTTVTYTVPAIHCGHCTHTIEMEVGELQGVQSVKADQSTKKVQITFNAPASEEKIKALLAEIDYPAEGLISL